VQRHDPLAATAGPAKERAPAPAPDRAVLLVVGVGLAVRAVLAALVPLTTDEGYYVDWARHLAAGYLDHPPLVAWLIAGPLRFLGHHALAVRLPAILLQAGTTLFAASLGRALAGGRAALLAAVMLQAAPVFSLGAVLITPDAPLAFAWAGALWALERALRERVRGPWFLALGLFVGVGALSKLHAGLLGVAVAAALLATRDGRRALATPWPWLGAALSLAVASPMLLWNAAHGWPTFLFQARHGMRGRAFSLVRLLGSLGGQAAYVSPLLLAAAAAAAWSALTRFVPLPLAGRGSAEARPAAIRAALALSALPVAAFFTLSAAFTPGALPHWTAPAWLSAMLLLAAAGSRLLRPAVWVGLGMSALLVVALPLAPRFVGSPLDELRGWSDAVREARAVAPGARLATTHWMALGHLGWYAEEPLAYVSDRPSAPDFYPPDPDPRPLLVIAPAGLGPDRAGLEALCGPLEPRGELTARYGGRAIRTYRFYAGCRPSASRSAPP